LHFTLCTLHFARVRTHQAHPARRHGCLLRVGRAA
jgi:hypothetical protein